MVVLHLNVVCDAVAANVVDQSTDGESLCHVRRLCVVCYSLVLVAEVDFLLLHYAWNFAVEVGAADRELRQQRVLALLQGAFCLLQLLLEQVILSS